MQLDAPALVGGILRQHDLADGVADRVLLPGIDAHLASEHADGIGALAERAVLPALYGGEAELNGLARRRMLPCASRQLGNGGTQLALPGRCCQQPANDGKAQMRPPLVDTPSVLGTSCLLWHTGAPLDQRAERSHGIGTLATSILCGCAATVIEPACQSLR